MQNPDPRRLDTAVQILHQYVGAEAGGADTGLGLHSELRSVWVTQGDGSNRTAATETAVKVPTYNPRA